MGNQQGLIGWNLYARKGWFQHALKFGTIYSNGGHIGFIYTLTYLTDLSDTECEENHVKEQGVTVLYRNDVSAPKVTSWQERLEKSQKPKVPRERVNKKCPMCGMYFRFKGPYEDHILKHDNPAPYKCGICSASFKSKGSFFGIY